MKESIGYMLSRVRGLLKAVKQDAFITDRFLYSLIVKHTRPLIKREDSSNRLNRISSIFEPLDYVELKEVDKVYAYSTGLKSGISIFKTAKPLPKMYDGYTGPKILSMTSLDGSTELTETDPTTYMNIAVSPGRKYNKTKYYWFHNGEFYFPDIKWKAIRILGLFEGDISPFKEEGYCLTRQQQNFCVPDYLFPEIEGKVLQELGMTLQIPSDTLHDKQNIVR